MVERVRIAFLSEHSPGGLAPFSGIPYFMSQSLASQSKALHYIHVPSFDLGLMMAAPAEGRLQLREIGESVSRQLQSLQVDAVVCQGSSMIPFLETDRPVVLWHDSTWQTLLQLSWDEFLYCYPLLYEWDQRVLQKCDLIAYASEWVRDATLNHYQVDPAKLEVLPFGASLHEELDVSVDRWIEARRSGPCQLTFIGVDWMRKGLPLAHSVTNELNRRGVLTSLNVVGCVSNPPRRAGDLTGGWDPGQPFSATNLARLRLRSDARVRTWGLFNKDDDSDYRTFCRVLRESHFLLHPARFECFGVALVEANAFAVPVLASDQFGPRSIVKEGVNGYLFGLNDFVAKAVELIHRRMEAWDSYRADAESAFGEYRDRLTWSISCRRLLDRVTRLL